MEDHNKLDIYIKRKKKKSYLHQFVDMMTDQLMGRNKRQTPELVVSDNIMGLSKGHSWVVLDTFPNLALSLWAGDRGSKSSNF